MTYYRTNIIHETELAPMLQKHYEWLEDRYTGIKTEDCRGVQLKAEKFDMRFDLSSRDLSFKNLSFSRFKKSTFVGCDIRNSNLHGIRAYSCSFSRANFHGANLTYCKMHGCNFTGADLSYSNLSRGSFAGSNFNDADFSYSNLSYANLDSSLHFASNFTGANLFKAKFNENIVPVLKREELDYHRAIYFIYSDGIHSAIYTPSMRVIRSIDEVKDDSLLDFILKNIDVITNSVAGNIIIKLNIGQIKERSNILNRIA